MLVAEVKEFAETSRELFRINPRPSDMQNNWESAEKSDTDSWLEVVLQVRSNIIDTRKKYVVYATDSFLMKVLRIFGHKIIRLSNDRLDSFLMISS